MGHETHSELGSEDKPRNLQSFLSLGTGTIRIPPAKAGMTHHPMGTRGKAPQQGAPSHTPNLTLHASLTFPFKRITLGEKYFLKSEIKL